MKMIYLLLTFDYELPLGGVKHSYEHSLFAPTSELLNVSKKLEVPLVFFADILSYVKFGEWADSSFTSPFKAQVQDMLGAAHDVQLHLHPHWLTSKFKKGSFIPSSDFELADFANHKYPENIEGIIDRGINQLTNICRETDDEYKCIAFRAGGYNLNRETKRILTSLYNSGIRFDSSISRGYYFRSGISRVDYRNVPNAPNWYLGLEGDLSKSGKRKGIFEVPIASKPKGFFEMPTRFKLKKFSSRAPENRGNMIHTNHQPGAGDKIRQLFASRMLTVDNHTYAADYMLKILDYNVQRFKSSDEIYLSLIGHPKTMGSYSLKLLSLFIEKCRDKYGDGVEFCTFRDLHNKKVHENYG